MLLSKLEWERPDNPHESLNAYYETMGTPYEGPANVMREKLAALDPGEPKLVVGISSDGSIKMRSFEENGSDAEGNQSGVRFLELPEDEFYFFKAFRHGLFEWEKQVPAFLLQMAFCPRLHALRELPSRHPLPPPPSWNNTGRRG